MLAIPPTRLVTHNIKEFVSSSNFKTGVARDKLPNSGSRLLTLEAIARPFAFLLPHTGPKILKDPRFKIKRRDK